MPAGAARRALLAASLLCVLPAVADAQNAPAELRRRMDAFARALREQEPMARIASFFPRDSAWEFVETPDRKAPGAAVVRRRFEPDSTLRAISAGGPICHSFGGGNAEVGPREPSLVARAMESRRPWPYVGRLRFVPPGARAGSPDFVEWRRERGAWVVSRVGELYYYHYSPRVIGRQPPDPTRDTTAGNGLPLERRLAVDTRWFRNGEPISVAYRRYEKSGLPRLLDDSLLVRYGSLGVVPVFAPRGERGSGDPPLLFVPVAPGEYQPYYANTTCRA
jgi:hypothetical protein